jgi:hypothetical protein
MQDITYGKKSARGVNMDKDFRGIGEGGNKVFQNITYI